jgi:hypothetical protein
VETPELMMRLSQIRKYARMHGKEMTNKVQDLAQKQCTLRIDRAISR